ncbi:hypothetical protein PNOK_0321400 [Pyrrhoderma noxium]|uniref:Uncharacterized protein n=1 Tax=Pyrrhoderma noxium TaxID=2282107 RepID=A0A286ULV0_9AGAM|nr:hypothetical protein PNOK_0321400 [Pyrrhoderma noxium]
MFPSVARASARTHKPLIHFIGKRQWPSKPEPPTAHPAGPPEYKAHFEDFLKKFKQALAGPSSTKASSRETSDSSAYEEFWQAPSRLWNPRVHHLTEAEVEAIQSGGASLH